jgi:hypothetical protein
MTNLRQCWFAFSLRTLFVGILLIGGGLGWLGRERRIVRDRLFFLERLSNLEPPMSYSEDCTAPLSWRCLYLNDVDVVLFNCYGPALPASHDAALAELFPNCRVILHPDPSERWSQFPARPLLTCPNCTD